CKKLECFCHVSTCYANSNRKGIIEEKLYSIPGFPEDSIESFCAKVLQMGKSDLESFTKQTLQHLGFPNTYTFSKYMTEHLLYKHKGDIPLVIVRPSVVDASFKDPYPGWLDTTSAASSFYLGFIL